MLPGALTSMGLLLSICPGGRRHGKTSYSTSIKDGQPSHFHGPGFHQALNYSDISLLEAGRPDLRQAVEHAGQLPARVVPDTLLRPARRVTLRIPTVWRRQRSGAKENPARQKIAPPGKVGQQSLTTFHCRGTEPANRPELGLFSARGSQNDPWRIVAPGASSIWGKCCLHCNSDEAPMLRIMQSKCVYKSSQNGGLLPQQPSVPLPASALGLHGLDRPSSSQETRLIQLCIPQPGSSHGSNGLSCLT